MSNATPKDAISLHKRTLAGTGRVHATARQERRFRKNLKRQMKALGIFG
jgi:hypothetical protein